MNQNPNAPIGGMMCALVCILVILAVVLAIYIFFCLTLQRTQQEVRPRNRLIPPGTVWLHLLHLGGSIPLVGIVIGIAASIWDLVMVIKLAGSLKLEFEDRGWRTDGESFGRTIGVVWVVGQLAALPLGFAFGFFAPQIQTAGARLAILGALAVFGITMLVCWIVYWVQMASYGRRLREGRGRTRRGGVEEDYDDEFYARRRGPDDDRDIDDDFDRPRRRRLREDEEDDYDDRRKRRRDED